MKKASANSKQALNPEACTNSIDVTPMPISPISTIRVATMSEFLLYVPCVSIPTITGEFLNLQIY